MNNIIVGLSKVRSHLFIRAMDIDVYSDLCNVRDMNEVLDALLEALNPLEEGVSMGVAEEMDDENDYEGQDENTTGTPC